MKKFLAILGMLLFAAIVGAGAFLFGRYEILHSEHVTSQYLVSSDTQHWHICKECGEEMNKTSHDFDEVVLVDATHETNGIMSYKCKDCNYSKLEEFSVVSTISEDEWNQMYGNMLSCNNAQMSRGVFYGGMIYNLVTVIKDGDKTLMMDSHDRMISVQENNGYFYYENVGFDEDWTKREVEEDSFSSFNGLIDDLFLSMGDYSSLTYNVELRAYETTIENTWLNLYFKDSKLVKIIGGFNETDDLIEVITFDYENIEVELPNI